MANQSLDTFYKQGRQLMLALLSLMMVLAFATPLRAQGTSLDDPRLPSPSSLAPSHSSELGSGMGLRSKKPNFGFEVGDFVIQPRFFIEGEYRSNFFRQNERNYTPEGVAALHLRPGVAIFNPIFSQVAMSFGVDVNAFLPFGSEKVSKRTNVGGKAHLGLQFFPKSVVTFKLVDNFERRLWMRPQYDVTANQNRNIAGAEVTLQPGGKAIKITGRYAYALSRYDDMAYLDTDEHRVQLNASWRFFPRTEAFLAANWTLWDYPNSYKIIGPTGTPLKGNYISGQPLKVYAGLAGSLTNRLGLLLRIGYGNSFMAEGSDNFEHVIGLAQVSFRFSTRSVLHAGFARDFQLTALGGQRAYMRPFLSYTQRFGELVELTLDAAYDIRRYGEWQPYTTRSLSGETVLGQVSHKNRTEDYLRAGVVADFDISRIFGLTLGYRYDRLFSDFSLSTTAYQNFVSYEDHRVYASLNLRY